MKQILGFDSFNKVETIMEKKLVHPIIYVDLDGTLCDFETAAVKVLGPDFKHHQKDQTAFWKQLAPPHIKNFFGTLDWMPGAASGEVPSWCPSPQGSTQSRALKAPRRD